jgi:hypothetical protein
MIRRNLAKEGCKGALLSVLGPELMVPLRFRGDQFYCLDVFPWRQCLGLVCDYKKSLVTVKDLAQWPKDIEKTSASIKPSVTLPSISPTLTGEDYEALLGGTYHEGWHRLRRGTIPKPKEIYRLLKPRWGGIAWKKHQRVLLDFGNILEDIRIERLGLRDSPGTKSRLISVHDLILSRESRTYDRELSQERSRNFLVTALRAFRDQGLGYDSRAHTLAWDHYKEASPEAVEFVLHGKFNNLLESAKTETDPSFQFWGALEGIRILLDYLQEEENNPNVPETLEFSTMIEDVESAITGRIKDVIRGRKSPSGEAPYCPYTEDNDSVVVYKRGFDSTGKIGKAFTEGISASSKIRSALGRSFHDAVEVPSEGSFHGKELSERHLIETALSVRHGIVPRQAFRTTEEEMDTSFAAVLMVDQSTSMTQSDGNGVRPVDGMIKALASAAKALTDLQVPYMVVGFEGLIEDGVFRVMEGYHRVEPVRFHVYKNWTMTLADLKRTLSNMTFNGTTPTGDAIEFASSELQQRREIHKLIMIFTDGDPDPPQVPTVRYQLRTHKEIVIGVGIGQGSKGVRNLFPKHIWSEDIGSYPQEVVKSLKEILRGSRLHQ